MKLFGIVVTALLLMSPMAFSSTELVCYHQTQSRNYSTLSVRVELSDDYESLKFEVLTSGRGDPFSPMKGEKATLQRHQSGKGWLSCKYICK